MPPDDCQLYAWLYAPDFFKAEQPFPAQTKYLLRIMLPVWKIRIPLSPKQAYWAGRYERVMRVGYFFNHADFVGGGEYSFIELMRAVRAQGVEPVAFVPGPGPVKQRLEEEGCAVVLFNQPSLKGPGLFRLPARVRALRRLIAGQALEVIHANGARCMLYAGLAVTRANVPVIWHVRVLERDGVLDRLRGRLADAIIANSKAVKDSLQPLVSSGNKIRVIYNSVPTPTAMERLDVVKHFNLPPQLPILLFVGRITREKSVETLIEVQRILEQKGRPHILLLVGPCPDTAYRRELESLIGSLHARNVVWAGEQDNIPAFMQVACLLALPSRREGFGRVILEAWQAGLPVVATAQGGPAELIEDGASGLLVPVGDPRPLAAAITRILDEPVLRQHLIEIGKERVRGFTPEHMAKQLIDVYQNSKMRHSQGE
ncbi:MAG: glycosyltransferase family 1 protein [Spartobacteria bacterium]|nr:glycosyltransferase family 1 protein [Spartobacteria bacterium]